MTLRPDEHVCTLLDTPELLDPNDSQVQDGQVFKKQRQADTIINCLPPPNPQGKHSILWIGRVPFVKDELNDLVYSGKSCMKVCKSEIYRPQVTCYSCMEQESIDCPCHTQGILLLEIQVSNVDEVKKGNDCCTTCKLQSMCMHVFMVKQAQHVNLMVFCCKDAVQHACHFFNNAKSFSCLCHACMEVSF